MIGDGKLQDAFGSLPCYLWSALISFLLVFRDTVVLF